MSCQQLSELQCIKSESCSLVQEGVNRYRCQLAVGKCEIGFRQWGENQMENCEVKPGCQYYSGNCYCPPDVICRCGGGKPPQCIEKKDLRQ
jgi:hypothetical protein